MSEERYGEEAPLPSVWVQIALSALSITCLCLGSYGWGGVAIDLLNQFL